MSTAGRCCASARAVCRASATLAALFAFAGCAGLPDSSEPPVRFAFAGDLAGQNVCRDATRGFPIFSHVRESKPDFFVALGDMIYADHECTDVGRYGNQQLPRAIAQAESGAEFQAHWAYVREDPEFAALLREVPVYAVWDDHEVRNDFGPASENEDIIATSRSVFAELHGIDPARLYRKRRFGKHLEMFFLDTRSYRDANAAADSASAPKTMLGAEQKAWLLEGLSSSEASWKIIVSSVPLSIPTGWPAANGRDGWANFDQDTGFEQELIAILRTLARNGVRNLVFVSADVHFATAFRYQPFSDLPQFVFHEFVTGPLNAGLFPDKALDPSLGPDRLFFYGPAEGDNISGFDEAQRWFNFGLIRIDAGSLHFELINGYGERVASISLGAQPP